MKYKSAKLRRKVFWRKNRIYFEAFLDTGIIVACAFILMFIGWWFITLLLAIFNL